MIPTNILFEKMHGFWSAAKKFEFLCRLSLRWSTFSRQLGSLVVLEHQQNKIYTFFSRIFKEEQ